MDEGTRIQEELTKYRERVIEECAGKIRVVLDEYKCGLVAIPQIQDGKIVAIVQVIAL